MYFEYSYLGGWHMTGMCDIINDQQFFGFETRIKLKAYSSKNNFIKIVNFNFSRKSLAKQYSLPTIDLHINYDGYPQ